MSKVVEIYDPPMCCSTGVCGPSVDPKLLAIQETILKLEAEGVTVKRYQVTTHPAAFLKHAEVAAMLRTPEGLKSLPVTTVNGTVISKGGYPGVAQIREAL
ncbi:MAG: transcriptional regulator [Firmicutes bacterium]|nr:transcriptional regulator [Bacillota bacterium]